MTINIKNCLLLLPLMTSCNKLSKYDVGPEAEVYQNESVNSGRNIEKNMSSSKMITKEQNEILDLLISGNVEKVLSDIKEKHHEDEVLKGEGYCYSKGMDKDGYHIKDGCI